MDVCSGTLYFIKNLNQTFNRRNWKQRHFTRTMEWCLFLCFDSNRSVCNERRTLNNFADCLSLSRSTLSLVFVIIVYSIRHTAQRPMSLYWCCVWVHIPSTHYLYDHRAIACLLRRRVDRSNENQVDSRWTDSFPIYPYYTHVSISAMSTGSSSSSC